MGWPGFAAAVTAAVHHATGIQVRELPIKIENLLPWPFALDRLSRSSFDVP
jgi:hypothetical protein